MPNELPLAKLVSIRPRFSRSICITRDWDRQDALEGYILTPSGRAALGRIASAIAGKSATRVWSLTGPYGCGKSSFNLFAAKILAGDDSAAEQATAYLKTEDSGLWKSLFGSKSPLAQGKRFWPVLVNGSREPLEVALLRGLSETVERFGRGRQISRLKGRLHKLTTRRKASGRTAELAAIFEATVQAAVKSGACGLVLIIDELGKLLEYAASHTDEGDVFILQELAEAATRSQSPFLIITTLHQALDRYTQHISQGRRQEWAKVQGRFEDIAFEEPTEQMLRLMALAIEHTGAEEGRAAFAAEGQALAAEAWALGARVGTLNQEEFAQVFSAAMPLHPSVALVLSPLFRKLAQNERSLFAFLASGEKFGFQEFLAQHTWRPDSTDMYRLDDAYDYVATALGAALYTHHRGKLWAEVQSALERLHGATETEIRLAKAIGLLQAIGYSAGIPASRDWLHFALKRPTDKGDEVDAAIHSLEQRRVVVYRRHADSYALWEGSDVDIEERMQEARRAVVDPGRNMVSYLSEHVPLRPLVARRHSYRTGTLRYFDVRYADREHLDAVLTADFGAADGRVVYCVPLNAEDRAAMATVLTGDAQTSRAAVLTVLPSETAEVKEHCQELACLHWIERNTPELDSDATARRELRARLSSARQSLLENLARVFMPSQESAANRCRWFWRGKEAKLTSVRGLNEFLSEVCDDVYRHTPTWRNELVNRRELSSSAAKARRNLIEAMIEHGSEESLGIQGTPPEKSMYDSLLRATRLHRRASEKWTFCPPSRKTEGAMAAIWAAIDDFLRESEQGPLPVSQLFARLGREPFGLKDGVLPILLAVVLLHFDTEIALYLEGTFVPVLSTPIFERIIRSPEKFAVQRCRIAGPRAVVFDRYATMLSSGASAIKEVKPKLLSIARPLFKLATQLPEYVTKTQQLSGHATSVLRAIKQATQPDKLLFADLPAACDVAPFSPKGRASLEHVDQFFGLLRSAIIELQQAYPKLVSMTEQLMLDAFRLSPPLAQARAELVHKAKLVSGVCVDPKVKSLIARATDATLDDGEWLESLVALLAGKPSKSWGDDDRARFEVNLSLTARLFHHFEALAFEMERSGTAILDGDVQALRVGVTLPNCDELERVVRIPSRLSEQARGAQEEIRGVLGRVGFLADAELSAAVLAQVVRDLLATGERPVVNAK